MGWGGRGKEVAVATAPAAPAVPPESGRGGGASRRGASRQAAAGKNQPEGMQELAERMARLESMTARGMVVGGNPGPKGGATWACACGFGTNFASRLTCFKCHLLRAHPSASATGCRTPSLDPSIRSRAASVAFASPVVSPGGTPVGVSALAALEEELGWNLDCLKLAKGMAQSKLRDERVAALETDVQRLRGEVRALRPLPQRLQAALAREAHQSSLLKTAAAHVTDCDAALRSATAAWQAAKVDHDAAAAELADVQAAVCTTLDEPMAVDSSASLAAAQGLGQYLSTNAAADPHLRALLASLGQALGGPVIPWADSAPPLVEHPDASVAGNGEAGNAALLAARLIVPPPVEEPARRQKSRSPTSPNRGKSSSGKGTGTVGGQAQPLTATLHGLAALQAELGLSGVGKAVPTDEDEQL